MIFTKNHQNRLLTKYISENPKATSFEIKSFMKGVEIGIVEHMNYLQDFKNNL